MLTPGLRALEIRIDLAVIDANLPCQKPQNAKRQDLAIRKRPAGISQQGYDTGKAQPVRGLVLPHDQVEIRPVQRVMFGDLSFVLRDGCRLLPPYLAQQCSSGHCLGFQFRCGNRSELENTCPTNDRFAASTVFVRKPCA